MRPPQHIRQLVPPPNLSVLSWYPTLNQRISSSALKLVSMQRASESERTFSRSKLKSNSGAKSSQRWSSG